MYVQGIQSIKKGVSERRLYNKTPQYAKQESNEVERYSETKITAPFYDP